MASLFLLQFLQGKDVRKRATRGTLICTSVTEQTLERFHESVQMFSTQTSIIGTKATLSREVPRERGTLSTLPQTLEMNYQTLHTLVPERAARAKQLLFLSHVRHYFCSITVTLKYSLQSSLAHTSLPPNLPTSSNSCVPSLPCAGGVDVSSRVCLGAGALVKWYGLIDGVGMSVRV